MTLDHPPLVQATQSWCNGKHWGELDHSWNPSLGYTKLMLCFMDYLPSQGDPAGQEKIK